MTESVQQAEIEQQDSSLEPDDEMAQLRRDIARQIRSNQLFLEGFLNKDFPEEASG